MKSIQLLTATLVVATLFTCVSSADWSPQCYNAVKWTAPDQGQNTIAYTSAQGITRVPMAYHGGVDWNESGSISEKNIEHFTSWVNEYLPPDYCGPVVMDYEKPWRKELSDASIQPERLQKILTVFIKGVQVAREALPRAQWGYWGMPLLKNTRTRWQEQGLSLDSLTSQCSALYPDIYDCNPSNLYLERTKEHITRVLEIAGGRIPVYVFVSPRFSGQGGDRSQFVPHDVFLKRVNAAMQAVWVNDQGVQHKIQGLILWDSYGFSPESEWADLDQKHKYYFELLNALTQAWKKESNAVLIETGLSPVGRCQYALPEPANSATTLDQSRQKLVEEKQTRVLPDMQSDPAGSIRIRSNRIKE